MQTDTATRTKRITTRQPGGQLRYYVQILEGEEIIFESETITDKSQAERALAACDPERPEDFNANPGDSNEVTRKLGSNRGKLRLWLEGKVLASAGWEKGTRFNMRFEGHQIIYERADDGSRKVAGGDDRPVIDTNSNQIADALAERPAAKEGQHRPPHPAHKGAKCKVTVTAQRIIIKLAAIALAAISFCFFPAHAKKVLVACEFSGTVRDAFAERGHFAVSCDLRPSEKAGQHDCAPALHPSGSQWCPVVQRSLGDQQAVVSNAAGVSSRLSARTVTASMPPQPKGSLSSCASAMTNLGKSQRSSSSGNEALQHLHAEG